jgi:hypothetical protein
MAVMKIVRFRLRPGADEEEFLRLHLCLQREIAPHLPGLLRRKMVRTRSGEWIFAMRYANRQLAERAAPAVLSLTSTTPGRMALLVDLDSTTVEYRELAHG